MNKALYERLKQVAREETTTTYGEVAPVVGLDMARPEDRSRMAELLDEISEAEHEEGRPLLSAVVVHAQGGESGGIPGSGFFSMAKSLGVFDGRDKVSFFARELMRVYGAGRQPQTQSE